MITITNEDNMILMARYPDNYFDLAIVDPPYDFSITKTMYIAQGKQNKIQPTRPKGGFKIGGNYVDSLMKAPSKEYFNELFRVSKNQIIWGGNYFDLKPSCCWIVWDKCNGENYFADAELAWTSFESAVRIFKYNNPKINRIHPTQKPIKLYQWLLNKYAKPKDKILDTHLGSGSIAIAIHELNSFEKMELELISCELDKHFFDSAMKRINNNLSQTKIF